MKVICLLLLMLGLQANAQVLSYQVEIKDNTGKAYKAAFNIIVTDTMTAIELTLNDFVDAVFCKSHSLPKSNLVIFALGQVKAMEILPANKGAAVGQAERAMFFGSERSSVTNSTTNQIQLNVILPGDSGNIYFADRLKDIVFMEERQLLYWFELGMPKQVKGIPEELPVPFWCLLYGDAWYKSVKGAYKGKEFKFELKGITTLSKQQLKRIDFARYAMQTSRPGDKVKLGFKE